jgi:hypothetical protein
MIARLLRAAGLLAASPAGRSPEQKAAERQAAQRQQIRELAREVSNLTSRLQHLERGLDQLRALRTAEDDPHARSLLAALDPARATRHVRDAVAGAVRQDDPVPQLIVRDVWPPELIAAMLATMPAPAFFQSAPDGREILRLPPRLAPTPAMVVLAFAARFVDLWPDGGLSASAGALVRHPPDDATMAADHRPGHILTTVIDLQGGVPNRAVARSSTAGVMPHSAEPVLLTWEFAHYPSDPAP